MAQKIVFALGGSISVVGANTIGDRSRKATMVFLDERNIEKTPIRIPRHGTGSCFPASEVFPTLGNFFLALLSLAMTIGYTRVEVYPGGVEKPVAYRPCCGCEMPVPIYIFRLEAGPKPHAPRRCAIELGAFSAYEKIGKCMLICHLVDRNMPSEGASLFCMLAAEIVKGPVSIATAAAYGPSDIVAFGGPEEPFCYMGHNRCCPGLNVAEKRALIECVIAGNLLPPD